MSVGVIRGEVAAVARECGLEGEALHDVLLAVSEAASNAVIHGSVGREDARIKVIVGLSDVVMLVTVSDNGNGLQPSIETAGLGAGLSIIAALTRSLDIRSSPDGTEVHMAFLRSGKRSDNDDRLQQLEGAANRESEGARQRLDEALLEQDRLGELLDGANGTSTEFRAYVRLQDAGEQVAARQAWLNGVETESRRLALARRRRPQTPPGSNTSGR